MVQRLELADRFFILVLRGEKRNTLRLNEGNIDKGYLLLYSYDRPDHNILVWVTDVKTAPLHTFSSFYNMTAEELHTSMLSHYDDINMDSIVSLITYLSPNQTASEHGIPKECAGLTLLIKEEDLASV